MRMCDPGLPDVARAMAPLIGPDTIVLTAMNGVPWWFLDGFGGAAQGRALESVDAGGVIAQAIPARNVVGSVVHTSCSLEAPGFVKQHFGNRLIVGEPDGSRSPRLQALADTLQRGGIDVEVSSCIQKDIWFKLWGNLSFNPISALTHATLEDICRFPASRELAARMMSEARAVGEKLGVAFKDPFMGPLTTSLTYVGKDDKALKLAVNLRVPKGKSPETLKTEIADKLARRLDPLRIFGNRLGALIEEMNMRSPGAGVTLPMRVTVVPLACDSFSRHQVWAAAMPEPGWILMPLSSMASSAPRSSPPRTCWRAGSPRKAPGCPGTAATTSTRARSSRATSRS